MQKTASIIADEVLTKCAEGEGLSEQDEANLKYINEYVDKPFDAGPYAQLGGMGALTGGIAGAGGATLGSALGGGGMKGVKGNLKGILGAGAKGSAALGLGGLGIAGLIHLLVNKERGPMREQREEIMSRAQ